MLKSLAKKIGYLIAALIIMAAVLVCVIRFITPVLDEHRADFEKIASQFLQTPVSIKNVRVSWYQYQPVFRLNGVTVLDKESKEPVFRIKKVSILISIAKSLWQWKLVTSGIMASGAELNINESAKGELTVKEFSSLAFNQQPNKSETKFTDVLAWLSQEPHLILRNIDLYYTGFNGQKRFVTLYDLSFENSDSEHTILGKSILHQELPTEVTLAAQWKGKVTHLDQIEARAYLYVSGLSLSQWAKGYTWKGWQLNNGIVNAKIWATWNQGTFQKIQSTFESYGLGLYSETDKTLHKMNRLSGNVGWKREGNNQVFAGDDILVDLPHHLWPATNFYVSLMPDASGVLLPNAANIGYVDLADIQSFLFSSPALLPDSTKTILSTLNIKGGLQNTSIVFTGPWNDSKNISFNANFSQLGFSPWQKYPGMANLSGMIKWNGSHGELKLNSAQTVFQHNAVFAHDISIDQLSGDLQLENDANNNWLLNLSSLRLLNNDMSANVSGTITVPPNASPVADINANITLQKVANIPHYLPLRIFDKDLTEWLRQAFLSGEIQSAHAILRGPLADFPFDQGNGEFSIISKVKNIDFRFAPDWPLLHHVTGSVGFIGRKITVDVDSADTLGIPVTGLHGVIPYVGDAQPQILEVTANNIQTDFAHGLKYVRLSPLEKTIGKMFSGVDLQGAIALKLGLTMPLSHPDKTQVLGVLTVNDSSMDLVPWKLKLDHLNGQINFTENSTEAKNIRAELFNKPLQFDLTTKYLNQKTDKSKTTSVVQASFTNNFNLQDLEDWLKLPNAAAVKGDATIKGIIDFSLTAPLEVHLNSNLVGTTVDLIGDYGKTANEARDFSADVILQNDHPMRMKLNYGKLFSAAMILERKEEKYNLIGADIRFGSGTADWPASSGLYITGQLDNLDSDKIKTYMNQSSGNSALSTAQLKEVDIRVNRVNLGAQSLTQVRLQVIPKDNNWNININSPEIVGQITVPVKYSRQSLITAQLQKINMHSAANSHSGSMSLDILSIPAISLTANDVRFNDMPLGQITFKAVPSTAGLNIQSLRISSPRIDLRATGDWKKSGNGYVTHLQGGATSAKVSDLLNSLGMDVKNFISSNGSLNFDLTWPDAPFAPSLSSMNGSAALTMGAGRIVDIGAGNGTKMDIGRMLSIFSLQTIPRRLSLDFSDVFQKGYSFDSIRGDFKIQNGSLNTSNMRFDGPVAQVGINGRIGVKNKDYDFILSVTAHVTSSIPIAATLLTGNPLIGLGALAVNTVIGSQVSGVTTNYYAVTGPWNNPTWKSVKSAKSQNK